MLIVFANFIRRKYEFLLVSLPVMMLLACNNKATLFEKIPSSHSGIHFNNSITESDSINPLTIVNIYNGGGVGIGDFNNDGLQDIYFTGNQVSSKLYINKGNFKFEDVTTLAGAEGLGRWARGVSVIDINNDGLLDIYIANTIYHDSLRRQNILYVNQGVDKEGVPHFKDLAADYGLNIHLQSTMASFFDYDNDGDVDMYLTVNEASNGRDNPSVFLQKNRGNTNASIGRLYENTFDRNVKHPVFHDISEKAGIKYEGFGHAATICDINNDGWKDIYVSDDFLSNNILYVNKGNGTFTDQSKEYFKHTSFNAMGQDIVDINNDGLPDVIELDMNPEDNYRKKMMLASNSYLTYQNFEYYGYQHQYVRNTLQLNQGPRIGENDTIGPPAFSEIAFMSGIAQTDWSWCPLVTDFDNDSYRDMVITNGFPRDVSDHDFMAYRQQATGFPGYQKLLEEIPQVKLHNYAFHNNGDLTFGNKTEDWGLTVPTFSNGAAYADFDNDGAMDMVINNINDEALIYRNTSRDKDSTSNHFLEVKCVGDKQNINGLGAVVKIYYDHGKQQVWENNPYRGYLSSMQNSGHFGLGKIIGVDSLLVKWTNGTQQTIKNIRANERLTINIKDANTPYSFQSANIAANSLFKEVTHSLGISYKHYEPDVIDFDIQSMLPHKFSEYCPAIAAGDIDGNGFDDLVVGGNSSSTAKMLLQQADGRFTQKDIPSGVANSDFTNSYKDEGILLFDANGDQKPDLYIASGGYKQERGSISYQDRLYLNDGVGNFKYDSLALPVNHTSKLCVRAFDYNKDGKLDLFVSGRVDPGNYPKPVGSFIFRNDSKSGHVKFTDVTSEVAPELKDIGMVCDALFTDFDGDGSTDLLLTGEWMPVTFLKNTNGKFRNVTTTTGVGNQPGWWNSIVSGDFRHTGRMDYIIGNVGLNTLFKASEQYPAYVTANDFAKNGSFVPVPSFFLPDQKGALQEFPAFSREDMIERLPGLKKKFNHYKEFASATMDNIFTSDERKGALRLKATQLQSCYIRNDGNGRFTMIPLPKEAQTSVINGMVADDFDGDGNLDVLISGNDFGTAVSIGRYDGVNGLLLRGNGEGKFIAQSILRSGVYLPGNSKGLVKFKSSNGKYMVASSQNRSTLKVFELKKKANTINPDRDDVAGIIKYNNGKNERKEFYYGSSFLSQSTNFITLNENISSITLINAKGQRRVVDLNRKN